jgi:hypothetical protein
MARSVFTGMYALGLCHSKGLSSDVETTPVFGAGGPRCGLLELFGMRRYSTLNDWDQLI